MNEKRFTFGPVSLFMQDKVLQRQMQKSDLDE